MVSNHPPHRVGAPDNPNNPPEQLDGIAKLIWQLKNYGFPIARDTCELVAEYVKESDKSAGELNYKIVAQSLEQHNQELEFEPRNKWELSADEFEELHGRKYY